MKTLSITDKKNLKHTYQVVCNLLTQITRQQFEVQKVDDPINIADFNIVCNNTWQVLNPKMQEELLNIILNGNLPLDNEIINKIATTLGTSKELWQNLSNEF